MNAIVFLARDASFWWHLQSRHTWPAPRRRPHFLQAENAEERDLGWRAGNSIDRGGKVLIRSVRSFWFAACRLSDFSCRGVSYRSNS